jgi:uncharacterized protein with PIN domain
VERAIREKRIVLTRDTELAKRASLRGRGCFIRGNRHPEQLRQVIADFGIDPWRNFLTRCLQCNTPLAGIAKEEAAGKVPLYVHQTQDRSLPVRTAGGSTGRPPTGSGCSGTWR